MNSTTVPAEQVKAGMYLDPWGRTRVHTTLTRKGSVLVAYKRRGVRSSFIDSHRVGASVTVYTKENK